MNCSLYISPCLIDVFGEAVNPLPVGGGQLVQIQPGLLPGLQDSDILRAIFFGVFESFMARWEWE